MHPFCWFPSFLSRPWSRLRQGEAALHFPAEGLVQQRLLQLVERGELALVEGFETLGFFAERVQRADKLALRWKGRPDEVKVLDLLTANVRNTDAGLNSADVIGERSRTDEIN
jgi:hypothetical protein